ncbi:hypothetical protein [Pseudonocardia sp. H11422]|nr:hypothetical protein [Pseudonocardia sp. H11422]
MSERAPRSREPLTPALVAELQQVANAHLDYGVLRKEVDVAAAVEPLTG